MKNYCVIIGRLLRLAASLALVATAVLRADNVPPANPTYEQKIGGKLPLTTVFSGVDGRRHTLGSFFHGQPVILEFGYARCPQLCSVVADGTITSLRQLRTSAGRDYEVVAISIDPSESQAEAAARLHKFITWYDRGGADAGWHYLTGTATAIQAVTQAAGFHFYYDSRARLFVHPSGFVVATPEGVISRYFLGADFDPNELATALDQARRGQAGQTVFELLLICCRGDWIGGQYGPLIWRALWVGVLLTIAALAGGIVWMLREERRSGRHKTLQSAP